MRAFVFAGLATLYVGQASPSVADRRQGESDAAIRLAAGAEWVLRTATAFRDVRVGYMLDLPSEVQAFRTLIDSSDGLPRFRRILADGSMAGR
jgi:hypothetical protein